MNRGRIRRAFLAAFVFHIGIFTYAEGAPDKHILLWRIDRGPSTVFLLGSVHVAKSDIYPLNDYIEDAFSSSVRLAVEVDVSGLDKTEVQKRLLELGVLPHERSLSGDLGPETAAEVAERLALAGLSMDDFQMFRPWVAYMTLTALDLARLGYGAENGVDLHFLGRAGNREIVQLEGVDSQLELLAGLSDSDQVQLLREYLRESGRLSDETAALFDAWTAGDQARIAELATFGADDSGLASRMEEAFLRKRDAQMAEKIQELLRLPGATFVVVGAAHLVRPGSIIDCLGRSGYAAEAVRE
jgi:uncharacterized protein